MRAPTPAARRPGDEHDAEHRACEPGRLHEQECPDERRAEQRADRSEAACGADHGDRLGGSVLLDQMHREYADAAADRDQRSLRPEHDAEAQGRERREHDPGKLDRRTGPQVLNPSAGLCPAVPGR